MCFDKSYSNSLSETGFNAIKITSNVKKKKKCEMSSHVIPLRLAELLFHFTSIFGVRVRVDPTYKLFSVRTQPMNHIKGIKYLDRWRQIF